MLYLGEYQRIITSHGKIRIPSKWLKNNVPSDTTMQKQFLVVKSDGLIARFIEYPHNALVNHNAISECNVTEIFNLDPECESVVALNVSCTSYGWIQLPEEILQTLQEQTMQCKQMIYMLGVGNGFDILTKGQYEHLYQEKDFESLVDTLKFMKF